MTEPKEEMTFTRQLLYSTVRLEVKGVDSVNAGTAFIYAIDVSEGKFICLVTNKHVIKGGVTGKFFFTKSVNDMPELGSRVDVELDEFEKRWFVHPDSSVDLACMMLQPVVSALNKKGMKPFYRFFDSSLLPTEEIMKDIDAFEEVIFVGYPSGMYDEVNLNPVIRKGTTATPIDYNYNGTPTFLIDASVFPGSSGSPVLLYNIGSYRTRKGLVVGSRVLLLGVIAEVVIRKEEGEIKFKNVPTHVKPIVETQQMIDLGVVFKSDLVENMVQLLLATLRKNESA